MMDEDYRFYDWRDWTQHYTRREDGTLAYFLADDPMQSITDRTMKTYQVLFNYDGKSWFCFVAAHNVNEALGVFFKHHRNVCYNDVVSYYEKEN